MALFWRMRVICVYARGRVATFDAGIPSILLSIVFILLSYLLPNPLFAKNISSPTSQKQVPKLSDLETIKERGTLRIIVPSNLSIGIFPQGIISPLDEQQSLAVEFAHSLGVQPKWVPIDSYNDMLRTLHDGSGDLIIANIPINTKNKKNLAFSVPVDETQEVVLVRKAATDIEITKDLAEKSLVINGMPDHIRRAEDFKQRYPSIKLIKYSDGLFDEQVLDMIADGRFDATVTDHNIAKKYLDYRDDIRIAFNASAKKMRSWGLRPDSNELKTELDKFLTQTRLSNHHAEKNDGDLTEIKKRGVLRVILRNSASSYFWKQDRFMGFEYELTKAFAKFLDLKLSVIVPPNDKSVLHWLEEGKADIAAGFLTPDIDWKKRGIACSLPYHQTFQHIVIPRNHSAIHSATELEGKTVVVQQGSHYWKDLQELKQFGIKLKLQPSPIGMHPEEIIQRVASGEFETTLVDEHILSIEMANQIAVKSAFTFGDQISHTFAIRGENTRLLGMLNRFIKLKKDGPLYTRLYNKYFPNNKTLAQAQHSKNFDRFKAREEMISQYDHLIQKHSRRNGLDWRFISAQMFQESRFKPNAVSFAGATGLMQVMPTTAKILGFSDLKNPEISIKAGTKYMGRLFKRFEPELPIVDRMWFTLASYNAGIGHVMDARVLAKKEGLNPNRWFGNVEKAMLLLSESKYFKKARYGYVRGKEPVNYVRSIKNLYAHYTNIAHLDQITPKPSIAKVVSPKEKISPLTIANLSSNINEAILSDIEKEFQKKLDFNSISNEIASLEKDLERFYSF